MACPPEVLLLDDGELHEVAQLLESIGVPFTRLCGAQASADIAPPTGLVIATSQRAGSLRPGSPPGASRGRPLRILAGDEASSATRSKLRQLGFQLLVRLPAHRDIWQMLIGEALTPQSDEARGEDMEDSCISVTTGRAQQSASLRGIANRGCHLQSRREFRAGARVGFQLTDPADRAAPLTLSGKLVRVAGELDAEGEPLHSAAMLFDEDMSPEQRQQLSSLLNRWSKGAGSFARPTELSLPACDGPGPAGFSLDDETDPLLASEIEVELQLMPDPPTPASEQSSDATDRRRHERAEFPQGIRAESLAGERLLMGRNISPGGMRVAAGQGLREGERFRLAIYGPAEMDPFTVDARVIRDEGASGVALGFEDVNSETADKLEKLVACLPQLQVLDEREADPLGTVISQILSEI